jgi:ABC-2 type transport system ATP-binding protein
MSVLAPHVGMSREIVIEPLALQATGVVKRYGDHEALCGVDLAARPGQLHGLLGPNGAGKTTLMRVLLGLIRRDAGSVQLLGSIIDSTAGPIPAGVAGFVETPAFYPYLSGRQNLALLDRLDGHSGTDRQPRLDEALDALGLSTHANAKVAGYSAGMRQRLGLASALLRRPRLLFLDEPTSSLDPAGARDLRVIARRVADEGAAVVLSSHDMDEVEALCTDLTVLHHGRVVFSGTVDELRSLAPATVHVLRTADDRAALGIAAAFQGVKVRPVDVEAGGLEVSADLPRLDAYTVALGSAGVAIRALERRVRSLESLFIELTGHPNATEAPMALPDPTSHDARAVSVLS